MVLSDTPNCPAINFWDLLHLRYIFISVLFSKEIKSVKIGKGFLYQTHRTLWVISGSGSELQSDCKDFVSQFFRKESLHLSV